MAHPISKGTKTCVITGKGDMISRVEDVVDLIGLCGSHRTRKLIIHSDHITGDFFDLKSGLAGEIMQKFSNYSMKVAVVLDLQGSFHPRFSEMVSESNRSDFISFFENPETARAWIFS